MNCKQTSRQFFFCFIAFLHIYIYICIYIYFLKIFKASKNIGLFYFLSVCLYAWCCCIIYVVVLKDCFFFFSHSLIYIYICILFWFCFMKQINCLLCLFFFADYYFWICVLLRCCFGILHTHIHIHRQNLRKYTRFSPREEITLLGVIKVRNQKSKTKKDNKNNKNYFNK